MFIKFIRNQDGATALEYGLIVALIVIVSLSAIIATGTANQKTYDKVASEVKTATGN